MLTLHAIAGASTKAEPWPDVPLPADAQAYPIGEQLGVNGATMRLRGFTSDRSPERLAAWFRDHLPRPLVENKVGNHLVLGRASGTSYYITVRLTPADTGTQGVVAITDLRGSAERFPATRAAAEKLLSAFPMGTRILQSMTSKDAGRNSTYVVLANTYGEEANTERVKQMLRRDGYELEREARAADADAALRATLPRGAANGRTLFFRGKGREAIAVISRMPDNRVVIALNTITSIESFK